MYQTSPALLAALPVSRKRSRATTTIRSWVLQ
jgi:hypothetical protein